MMHRPVRTVAWTLALVATGFFAGGVVVLVATTSMAPIEERAKSLAERTLPADSALQATVAASGAGQAAFLKAIATSDPVERATSINQAQLAGQRKDAAWARYLAVAGTSRAERRLQRQFKAADKLSQAAAATVIGSSPGDAGYAVALRAEQDAAARIQRVLGEVDRRFLQPASNADAQGAVADASDARRNVLVAFGAAVVVFFGVGVLVLRRALRFEQAEARRCPHRRDRRAPC